MLIKTERSKSKNAEHVDQINWRCVSKCPQIYEETVSLLCTDTDILSYTDRLATHVEVIESETGLGKVTRNVFFREV